MVAEMVLKTIAYGPSGMMGDALHSLDFACVLIALVRPQHIETATLALFCMSFYLCHPLLFLLAWIWNR